jgi:hypothetical protein
MKELFILLIVLFLSMIFLSSNVMALNDKYGAMFHLWQGDLTDASANLFLQTGAKWVEVDNPVDATQIQAIQMAKSKGFNIAVILWGSGYFSTLSDWKNHVTDTVTKLKGTADAYEVWAEPESKLMWWGYYNCTPTPTCTCNFPFTEDDCKNQMAQKYFNLLQTAYTIIKSIDPTVPVIGINNVVSYYDDIVWDSYWFAQKVVNLGGKNYMDAFGLHPYDKNNTWEIWTPDEPPWSDKVIANIKNNISSYKQLLSPLPLWITETGYDDYETVGDQSWMMNRVFKMLNEVGATKIVWYEFEDLGSRNTALPLSELYYGLVNENLERKESFYTFKLFAACGTVYSDGTSTDGLCHVECKASTNCAGARPGQANACCNGCYYTDVTKDGKVRVDDVLAVATAFGTYLGGPPNSNGYSYNPNADINNDGKVRVDDVLYVAQKYGCPL